MPYLSPFTDTTSRLPIHQLGVIVLKTVFIAQSWLIWAFHAVVACFTSDPFLAAHPTPAIWLLLLLGGGNNNRDMMTSQSHRVIPIMGVSFIITNALRNQQAAIWNMVNQTSALQWCFLIVPFLHLKVVALICLSVCVCGCLCVCRNVQTNTSEHA